MDGRGRCYDNIFIERLWRSRHWYRLSKSAKTDSVGLRGNEKIIKD
jgi:transposase InsO family protein